MKSLYECMDGTYCQEGDYFAPNLIGYRRILPRQVKYGRMRHRYLKAHRPALYNTMTPNDTLHQHLAEIVETCHERMERRRA